MDITIDEIDSPCAYVAFDLQREMGDKRKQVNAVMKHPTEAATQVLQEA